MFGSRERQKELRRSEDVLAEVARKYGGTASGGGWMGRPRMTATVGRREITVEVWSNEDFQGTDCRLALPRHFPKFVVHPAYSAQGTEDITLGDPVFDKRFVVKADDAGLVRRAWDLADARTMVRVHAKGSLSCNGPSLHLRKPGLVGRPDEVIAGLELLTSIASRDVYGIEALRALPEAKLAADQAHLPGGIRVGPFELQSRTVTRALGPCAGDSRFHFAVSDGDATDVDLQCLPVDARSYVKAFGSVQILVSDGEAQIRWRTIETDPARLAAAVAVLRILARGPSLGAFR